MPKTKIDYQKTIIYKIVCNDTIVKDLYVGHTTDFRRRKHNHKGCCMNINLKNYNLKIYTFIRDNGGWENWSMIEIEKYPCNDSNEASARERYWYDELQPKLNSNIPIRDKKEYYEENIEYFKKMNREYHKEYYVDNKEIIAKKHKNYRDNNKDKMKEYHKQYYLENKEKYLARDRERSLKKKIAKLNSLNQETP